MRGTPPYACLRTRANALVGLLLAVALLVSDCADDSSSGQTKAPAAAPASIALEPADGAKDVRPDAPLRVSASGGRLTKVAVTAEDGHALPGTIEESGGRWAAGDLMSPGETYTVHAEAVNREGRSTRQDATFATLKVKRTVQARVSPLDGETVGVGMPIVVWFTEPVTDRAALERRLSVNSSKPVTGSWYWMSDTEVHYRPKEFWPAHSKVTLRAALDGVHAGKGVWGDRDRRVSFEVGRSSVSHVNVKSHRMTVYRDGKLARTIPVSAGKAQFQTRSGIKVVLAKERDKVMDARSIGIQPGDPEYYRLDVRYAVRVTWSGEFVHAAPWSVGAQGSVNVSHGCVGMSTANARWYFNHTMRGDVVTVTGSPRQMELQNGFGDWNLSWKRWLAGSALHGARP